MADDFLSSLVIGSRKASVHVIRAGYELVRAGAVFVSELVDALDDEEDEGVERVPVDGEEE